MTRPFEQLQDAIDCRQARTDGGINPQPLRHRQIIEPIDQSHHFLVACAPSEAMGLSSHVSQRQEGAHAFDTFLS
jgi:hypothetical protein